MVELYNLTQLVNLELQSPRASGPSATQSEQSSLLLNYVKVFMSVELGTVLRLRSTPRYIRKFSRGKNTERLTVDLIPDRLSFFLGWRLLKVQLFKDFDKRLPFDTQRRLHLIDLASEFAIYREHDVMIYQGLVLYTFMVDGEDRGTGVGGRAEPSPDRVEL